MINFDFHGVLGLKVQEGDTNLVTYLRYEYGALEVPFLESSGDLVVEWATPEMCSEDITRIVRPPVGIFKGEVCLFDTQGNQLLLNLKDFGSPGYTIQVNPAFNPHFFAIALEYIVGQLLALSEHYLCHASSVRHRGEVLLFPAWRHTGKTNVLLDLLLDGAEYIADDWAIISSDGKVFGLPKRLNLLHYNFLAAPEIIERMPSDFVTLHSFVRRAEAGEFDLNTDVLDLLREQARLRVSVKSLFEIDPLLGPLHVDRMILLLSGHGDSSLTKPESITRKHAAKSISGILAFEQQYFRTAVDAFHGLAGGYNEQLDYAQSRLEEHIKSSVRSFSITERVTVPHQSLIRPASPWLLSQPPRR